MTESATFAWLEDLLKHWQAKLGLTNWAIAMRLEPCESETAYMEVERSCLYERAVLRVQPWLISGEFPKDVMAFAAVSELEETLVHELLHLHTRDIVRAGREAEGHMHRDAYGIYEQRLVDAEEQLVDRIAAALVRSANSA